MRTAKEMFEITKATKPKITARECADFIKSLESTILLAAESGKCHCSTQLPVFTDEEEAIKQIKNMLRAKGYAVNDMMSTVLKVSWASN